MDKPDVFMPLYIGDYLAGTSRLTTELHGAYLLLIMDYWMNGPLPDDDALLASITKMTPDAWSIARAKLKHYFIIDDGCWKQKRIEEELAAATEKKRKAREKAKKAAAERWSNASSNAPSNASAMLKECPSPSPSPSPSDSNTKDSVPSKDGTYPPEFEEIWKLKPKREGGNPKAGAFKAYKARLKQGATLEEIKDGVIRYKKFCDAKGLIDTDKVQMMQTFLGPNENFRESWTVKTGVTYGARQQGFIPDSEDTSWAEGFDPTAGAFDDLNGSGGDQQAISEATGNFPKVEGNMD